MGDVVEQAKEALYGGDAEEGRSHLYPLINEITRLEGELWLAQRASAALKDEAERLERVVAFAAAHGPETCPKSWPEGCARAVVSMAQRSIPDPTYSLADEEGKADE